MVEQRPFKPFHQPLLLFLHSNRTRFRPFAQQFQFNANIGTQKLCKMCVMNGAVGVPHPPFTPSGDGLALWDFF